jgi:hypothetical protein
MQIIQNFDFVLEENQDLWPVESTAGLYVCNI